MTDIQIIITVIISAVILLLLGGFFIPPIFISKKVYFKELVRTDKEKWGRACSAPDNEEQVRMYNIGEEWANENMNYAKDVEIENDNLHLVGQYFDFGFDRAVIILQGRTESYLYSHYFAKPYKELGFNILVIDSRAHGLSDGIYNCVGLKEYSDVIKWSKLLVDNYGIKKILLHGICIGSATALYAITKSNEDFYLGMIADGMFTTFYETFKTHMRALKRPVYPFARFVMWQMKKYAGVDAVHNGPIHSIDKLNVPLLMIHSKEDIFSLPKKAEILYAKCQAPKRLVWFDHGAHSHIRINNQDEYDNAIKSFVNDFIDKNTVKNA